jgi:hypothetical protein
MALYFGDANNSKGKVIGAQRRKIPLDDAQAAMNVVRDVSSLTISVTSLNDILTLS